MYGDLLKILDVDAIVHQVNCLCVRAHGLSKQIVEKFPWSNIYSQRQAEGNKNLAVERDRGIPGTIKIFKSPVFLRPDIICFLSQWNFGTPDQSYRNIPPHADTRRSRLNWFRECLTQLENHNITTVGIPWQIGCGLGGGDWNTYFELMEDFSKQSGIEFIIVIPHFARN